MQNCIFDQRLKQQLQDMQITAFFRCEIRYRKLLSKTDLLDSNIEMEVLKGFFHRKRLLPFTQTQPDVLISSAS
ncbi:hypothetical protein ABH897_005533 [Paenibacillus sp. RC73]